MATKTAVNGQTVVHKTSDGQVNTFPDVCLTQVGNAVVPIPYSNTAVSQDTSKGSKTVFVDGNPIMLKDSVFSKSTGDEAGDKKGVGSGTVGDEAKFVNYSFDVSVEGRNVCRRLDPMTSNKGNTPPAALMQPNITGKTLGNSYPLSVSFVYKYPEITTNRNIRQPVFQALNTIKGPETHRWEDADYPGSLYMCAKSGGEYSLSFDEFDDKEDKFEE
jgi:hypothetical protein